MPPPLRAPSTDQQMVERYVEQALLLIDRTGSSHGVNLREVARALKCAHTNAYNYFDSLDDLLSHCLLAAFERQYQHSRRAMSKAGNDPARRLELLTDSQIDFALAHPGWYLFVWIEPLRTPPPPRMLSLMQQASDELILLVSNLPRTKLTPLRARQVVEDFHTYLHGALCKTIAGRVPSAAPAELRRLLGSSVTRVLMSLVSSVSRSA